MILFEKSLYKLDSKGKIRLYNVKVINFSTKVILRKSSGLIDGRKIEVDTLIKQGKNIGRANEKTIIEQAISEAKSLITKKMKLEYSEKITKVEPTLLPMLASTFTKMKKKIRYPAYAQPKLDGARALFIGDKFISRKNTEYLFLDPIKDFYKSKFPKNLIWDGELYDHSLELNEIISLIRQGKESPQSLKSLKFVVYDVLDLDNPGLEYSQRLALINKYIKKKNTVQTDYVNSEDEVYKLHDTYVNEGYEGVMVKNANGVYKTNFRSQDVQKYKTFLDSEFTIVNFTEGKGKDAGSIVFIMKTPKGETFSCRPKGTLEERQAAFKNGAWYINQEMTVKYQKLIKESGCIRS